MSNVITYPNALQPVFPADHPVTKALFADYPKAQRARTRDLKEGPIEVLPGVMSLDLPFLKFKCALADMLTKNLPESVDDHGRVFGNGVAANFLSLRTVPGLHMFPSTIPMVDNTLLRAQQGLTNKFVNETDRKILRTLIKLIFNNGNLEAIPMHQRAGSSSCFPWFLNDKRGKIDLARYAFDTYHLWAPLISAKKYEEAYVKYYIGGASYKVYRMQFADRISLINNEYIPKDRYVADLEYAITGGASGRWFPASKSLDRIRETGIIIPDGMFAGRTRVANGLPGSLNYAMAPIAQSVRKHLYETYPFTFHHTTPKDKEDKIKTLDLAITVDVANHDMLWFDIRDEIVDVLRELNFDPGWVDAFDMSLRLPVFSTPNAIGAQALLLGDWRNPSLTQGLPSGHSFTDVVGTIEMSWCYLLVQLKWTKPQDYEELAYASENGVMRYIHSYLKGEKDICQIAKVDDAILGWRKSPALPKAETLYQKMKEGKEQICEYMEISYEHGGAFLGSILLYDDTRSPKNVRCIGNVNSMVVNMFSPEYGCASKLPLHQRVKTHRPFPGLSWKSLPEAYGSAPAYQEILDIIEHLWYKFYGESYHAYREKLYKEDVANLTKYTSGLAKNLDVGDLSLIDYDVLQNPDTLYYKYTRKDVHPAVMDVVASQVPLEDVEPYFKKIIPN